MVMADPLPGFSAPPKPALRGLYVITDSRLCGAERLVEKVSDALAGGASIVQYRDKGSDSRRRADEVQRLLRVCRAYRAPLIINDDVELARNSGADGVHLGKNDGSVQTARQTLGAAALIGVSCYDSLALALRAQDEGADYVAFGAFYPSATKPHATPVALEVLIAARARLRIPIAAIGGITAMNGEVLVRAGADMLAVVRDLFDTPDPRAAAQCYQRLF